MAEDKEHLKTRYNLAPNSPGIYTFLDANNKTLYVGKAKNIKKRLSSYFRPVDTLPPKTRSLMQKAFELDFIVTASEKEAFLLECTLIKKHRPRYNILLKDNKNYPSIRINIKEDYPVIRLVRRQKDDGAIYMGPFSSSSNIRKTLKVVNQVYPLRKCRESVFKNRTRPCIYYQMERCLAPCCFKISTNIYMDLLKQAMHVLQGRSKEVSSELEKAMLKASKEERFEDAIKFRNRLQAIQSSVQPQSVTSTHKKDYDLLGLYRNNENGGIMFFFIRQGALCESHYMSFTRIDEDDNRIILAAIKLFYGHNQPPPDEIIVPILPFDMENLLWWLREVRGKKVDITEPKRGEKKRLLLLAIKNAQKQYEKKLGLYNENKEEILKKLQYILSLKSFPHRIECYDISTIQGEFTVSSMAVFIDGMPDKKLYRRFRIKGVTGMDDFASMEETMERRFNKKNTTDNDLPDMILIDGGKGQLSAAVKILEKNNIYPEITTVAIAKDKKKEHAGERIFIPGRKNPVIFKGQQGAAVLNLLMHIRDEAHDFAVSYHRLLRGKAMTKSFIDDAPGIGIKRKKAILKHFKSINALYKASEDEISRIKGMNRKVAANLKEWINNKRDINHN